jgi:hypothetical protein
MPRFIKMGKAGNMPIIVAFGTLRRNVKPERVFRFSKPSSRYNRFTRQHRHSARIRFTFHGFYGSPREMNPQGVGNDRISKMRMIVVAAGFSLRHFAG